MEVLSKVVLSWLPQLTISNPFLEKTKSRYDENRNGFFIVMSKSANQF